ncbi:hypothetical protein HY495_00710 [Candidatus Woesearchaeota archaeon]|nr:hypothetical protein [Candidatus Woesearchaeota archaeon]
MEKIVRLAKRLTVGSDLWEQVRKSSSLNDWFCDLEHGWFSPRSMVRTTFSTGPELPN